MKVFNLTDVPTKELTQAGLINVTLVIGRTAVSPGESVEITDEPHILAQLIGYEKIGAMSRISLPAEYIGAKQPARPKVAASIEPPPKKSKRY
jgi:hypothetical protein